MLGLLIQLLMLITPAICAATIAMKFNELKRAGASQQWPAVKASITNSTIIDTGKKVRGQNVYQPQVSLAYDVDGQSFTVNQRPSDEKGFNEGPKLWAREMTLKYKPDTTVRLYYNPQRPKQVTLQPGHTTVNKTLWIVISAVMMTFSLLLCVLATLGITQNYLSVSTAVSITIGFVAFVIMLILGVLVYLLTQEIGHNKNK